MTGIASKAKSKVVDRLTGPDGLGSTLAALNAGPTQAVAVLAQNVAADVAERSGAVSYPAVSVYCEKIVHDLREKFRSFSGTVKMAIEIRHSQDRLEGLEDSMEQYTDAITSSLTAGRGDWGDGMFYSGGFDVSFGAVKRGGKNFTQTAKVSFEVVVSRD